MIDRAVVTRKLSSMAEHVARMRRRRPDTWADLAPDSDRQDAIALSLLVAVQEALDIALHMAADEAWGTPDTCVEAFDLLHRRGVIGAALAADLAAMCALRNRIAHGYATVDFERIWRELPAGVAALDDLMAAVARRMP